jgi:hypothetical protein
MSERPERVILLARGLDQHDDEGPGVVGKPDRADALADAPVHVRRRLYGPNQTNQIH